MTNAPITTLVNCTLAQVNTSKGFVLTPNSAITFGDSGILWIGSSPKLSGSVVPDRVIDCGGAVVTAGLIDAHTHLIYGSNRSLEYELRLGGATYEEIAALGGGIRSTVTATRDASSEALFLSAAARLRAMASTGTTTIEVKSGYGLSTESELKMLRVARALHGLDGVSVKTSFLGAHTVPKEFEERPEDYIGLLCDETLPLAHAEGLIDYVDGFCEKVAFTDRQLEPLYRLAQSYGLPVRGHVDQLTNSNGAALLARHGAICADHLEFSDDAAIEALARAGASAVLCPGAYHFLRQDHPPNIDQMRRNAIPMVVATDCNPGTSPLTSLPLAMHLACHYFGLTPAEALQGTTENAARALGLSDRGRIEVGARADLCVWNIEHPRELSATLGVPLLAHSFRQGVLYDHTPTPPTSTNREN